MYTTHIIWIQWNGYRIERRNSLTRHNGEIFLSFSRGSASRGDIFIGRCWGISAYLLSKKPPIALVCCVRCSLVCDACTLSLLSSFLNNSHLLGHPRTEIVIFLVILVVNLILVVVAYRCCSRPTTVRLVSLVFIASRLILHSNTHIYMYIHGCRCSVFCRWMSLRKGASRGQMRLAVRVRHVDDDQEFNIYKRSLLSRPTGVSRYYNIFLYTYICIYTFIMYNNHNIH